MDRPILFSAPMVRALLDGRKTQTRRLATSPLRRCEVGDRLWVRETFRHWQGSASRKTACYVADGTWIDHGSGWTGKPEGISWCSRATPSIHMPRWASRLTLIVEAMRVELLQEISETDAEAEGAAKLVHDGEGAFYANDSGTHRCGYAGLWAHLHGAQSWDANPTVVALTFRVERGNIDTLPPKGPSHAE